MYKIKNGKRYDTDTATRLATWGNGLPSNNFNHYSEDLYRTRTGNYFIHGYGGANSKYAERHGNSWAGSERIITKTLAEAQEWAEEHIDGNYYEAIFGSIDEGPAEESERIIITVSSPVAKTLREKKETTGATVSWLVNKALRDAGYGEEK